MSLSCLNRTDFKKWRSRVASLVAQMVKKWRSFLSPWHLCLIVHLRWLWGADVYKQRRLQWLLNSYPLPPPYGLHGQDFLFILVVQSCLTLCNPMGCSQPGSSVHGVLQARILEWVAIPFSRGCSPSRDGIQVSCIACRFFTIWATWEGYWQDTDQLIKVVQGIPW